MDNRIMQKNPMSISLIPYKNAISHPCYSCSLFHFLYAQRFPSTPFGYSITIRAHTELLILYDFSMFLRVVIFQFLGPQTFLTIMWFMSLLHGLNRGDTTARLSSSMFSNLITVKIPMESKLLEVCDYSIIFTFF